MLSNKKRLAVLVGTALTFSLLPSPSINVEQGQLVIAGQQAEAAAKSGAKTAIPASDMKYGGKYSYTGKSAVTQEGKAIAVDADYSAHKKDDWSEIKLQAAKEVDLTGKNTVSFDLTLQPKAMTQGGFKTKVYAKVGDKEVINETADIDLAKGKAEKDGSLRVPVVVHFTQATGKAGYFCLSLVGSRTDYKGRLGVENIALSKEKINDGYVTRKVMPQKQAKLSLAALTVPQSVKLSDPQASAESAKLMAYFQGLADSSYILYGHQNDLTRKAGTSLPGPSDTWDATGTNAAVMGVDALALTGNELELTPQEKKAGLTLTDKLANIYLAEAKKGVILTMSMHLPNFAKVAERPKVDGHYDYGGYSPNDLSGNVVARILPGGDLNEVYRGYLDMVAGFDAKLQQAGVPLLFRPFHENNGSWFWWGASACSPSEFKNLFRYTVDYLRQEKGLHNLVTIYSPNGPIAKDADYMARYPGDAWVDIFGLDFYHHNPEKGDTWMDSLDASLTEVEKLAAEHGKVATLSEVGIIAGNGICIARTGNQRLDWYDELLAHTASHKIPYLLTWADFDTNNFCQPFLVSKKRGQELIDSFTRFYNKPQTIFEADNADWQTILAKAEPAVTASGYLTAPNSFAHLLGVQTFTAVVNGSPKSVEMAFTPKSGTAQRRTAAKMADGYYKVSLTADEMAALGETPGMVALLLDGKSADSVPVLFNMPVVKPDPYTVDTFDTYYGDDGLLAGAYSKNCGNGSDVVWKFSEERDGGAAGLAFHYHIAKGGYAGIVKQLKGVDWSDANAIEFWIHPDGKAQHLLIQLNSGGEDFEADLTSLASQTKPQKVRIPFAQFVGKNGGTFDKKAVQHFGIYCNSMSDETVDSTIYFDSIRAVK